MGENGGCKNYGISTNCGLLLFGKGYKNMISTGQISIAQKK